VWCLHTAGGMLAPERTPAMGGGAREVALDFTHKDLTIEVQYQPGEHAAPAAHAAAQRAGRLSPLSRRRADRFAQPAFWGSMGVLLHSAQAGQLAGLRDQFREAMKLKQAEVGRAGMSAQHKPRTLDRTHGLAATRVPRLNLEAATTMSSHALGKSRTSRGAREHYTDLLTSPGGPFSAAGLRGAVTDRDMRRQWLASTAEFSRDSMLEPYATRTRPRTPFTLLSRKQIKEEEAAVRSESRRISQVLHRVNVSLMKGSGTMADPGAQERHNMLEDVQQEMRENCGKLLSIVKSSAELAGDERFKSTPHRYDFVRANHQGTAQTRAKARGAQYIRNSVVWTDKANSVLHNNTKKRFEVAEKVEDDLIRRDLRLQAATLNEEQARAESAKKMWLTATVLALLNFRYFRPKIMSVNILRHRSARVMQRGIRQFLNVFRARKATSMAVIKRWFRKNEEVIRFAARNRAANKIKLFIEETRNTVAVLPTIRRYKRAVVILQGLFRETHARQIATRKKLLLHYDKVERPLLVALVRDKIAAVRQKREAKEAKTSHPGLARMPSFGPDSNLIDWFGLLMHDQCSLPFRLACPVS